METKLEIVISAQLEELAQVEALVEKLYEEGQIPEAVYGNVLVVATEATLNAIHHGSGDDPLKRVRVVLSLNARELILEVSDEGEGYDPALLPDPTDPANLEKGSGRGVFIIKNLSDHVEFLNGGATIRTTFQLTDSLIKTA